MNFARLQRKFDRVLSGVLVRQGLNAGRVTLVWDSAPGPGSVADESAYTGAAPLTEEADALIHYVSATTVQKQSLGFKAGDAIITFSPRTVLTGRRNLWFLLRTRLKLAGCAVANASPAVVCDDTAGLAQGALITGLNVPRNATVLSVDSATQFTMSQNAAGAVSGQLFTADVMKEYVQAATGRGIEEFWDVTLGDQKMTTTLLLRLRGASAGLPAAATGDQIRVVDGEGTAVAYAYDGANLLPGAASSARAVVAPLTDGVTFTIAGTQAAKFSAIRGLQAASFSDSLSTDTPRMEFWTGGVCAATLTQAGAFGCANDFITAGTQPAGGIAFTDALGRWLFTINTDGVTAPLFTS
jgi:hypothetical protein